jgi:hypothetical protein
VADAIIPIVVSTGHGERRGREHVGDFHQFVRVTVEAVPTYTLRLSTKVLGLNSKRLESWPSAAILVTNVPIAKMHANSMASAAEIRVFLTDVGLLRGQNGLTPGGPLTYTPVKDRRTFHGNERTLRPV